MSLYVTGRDDWDDWVDAEAELEAVTLPPTLPSQLPLGVTVFANGVMLQEGEDYIVEDGTVILNSPSEDVSITCTYLEADGGVMHSQVAI